MLGFGDFIDNYAYVYIEGEINLHGKLMYWYLTSKNGKWVINIRLGYPEEKKPNKKGNFVW